jgi:chitin disaccharide deacetylase
MKKLFAFCLLSFFLAATGQKNDTIYLIVQGDDIGSSNAANKGCIESYKNGILTVTELMVPCPWFLQAAQLLKENPKLDVGLHLALNSEWSYYKWRPLTCCPSITDSDGYFYPMVWQREDMPKGTALRDAKWDYNEIEKELRAQIELALKHVPQITHLSGHMGWGSIDPKVEELRKKLAKEYKLETNPHGYKIEHFAGFDKAKTLDERLNNFNDNLNKLTPGIYLFVDHPGMDTPEMRDINHPGYANVAEDRDMVTKVLTDPGVKKTIKKMNIKLIGYKDLANIIIK